jgi:hypothetical protein
MWRLTSAIVAAAAAVLIATTGAEAAPVSPMANVRSEANDGLVGSQNSLVMQARLTPHGFSQGRKIGWHGRHHPPGWSQGRKAGWHHASKPPGLRR